MEQVKSKTINRTADEALDDSLQVALLTQVDIATIVSEEPRAQASR